MEIVARPSDWTSVDEESLAKFLSTPTGLRFIPKLLEITPQLLERGDVNEILIRNGVVRGIQIVANEILRLAQSTQPVAINENPTNYPSLDDPSKWDAPPVEPALAYVEPFDAPPEPTPGGLPVPVPTPESQITKE